MHTMIKQGFNDGHYRERNIMKATQLVSVQKRKLVRMINSFHTGRRMH